MKFKYGFTLIELIIAIAVIGVVFSVAVTSYTATQKNSRNNRRRADLELIRQALEAYKSENGAYPQEFSCDSSIGIALNGAQCDCHGALVWPATCDNQPTGGTTWSTTFSGYTSLLYTSLVPTYIRELPIDPINNKTYYYSYEPNCSTSQETKCGNQVTCDSGCCAYEFKVRLESGGYLSMCNPGLADE